MTLIDAETEVTLTDGTNTVQIIVTPRITHNWTKPDLKVRPLPSKLQDSVYTMLIDLGMNKFILTIEGYIRDDDSVTAEARLTILETLFNSTSDIQMYWGSSGTSKYHPDSPAIGGIIQADIREVLGRQDIDSSARLRRGGTCSISPTVNTSKDKCDDAGGTWTAYGKTYEITLAFVIGNNRVGG